MKASNGSYLTTGAAVICLSFAFSLWKNDDLLQRRTKSGDLRIVAGPSSTVQKSSSPKELQLDQTRLSMPDWYRNVSANCNVVVQSQSSTGKGKKLRREGFIEWLQNPQSGFQLARNMTIKDEDFLNCVALRLQGLPELENGKKEGIEEGGKSLPTTTKITPKPKAIIHVGPRKTGSTILQDYLYHKPSLFNGTSGFVPLGVGEHGNNHHVFAECMTHSIAAPECKARAVQLRHEDALHRIRKAREDNRNIIFSSESLDMIRRIDMTKLSTLFDGFDVHIVIVYRRFFEWIVSNFGESYRKHYQQYGWKEWWNKTDDTIGSYNVISSLSRPDFVKNMYMQHSAMELYRMYKFIGGFHNTYLINYHTTSDIVKSFFCDGGTSHLFSIPGNDGVNTNDKGSNKTSLCESYLTLVQQKGQQQTPKAGNKGESIAYDEIAVAAKEAGLIRYDDKKTIIARSKARQMIQEYFEQTVGWKGEEDIPKICLHGRPLDLLKELSLRLELYGFPEYYNEGGGKNEFASHWEQYRTTKLCAVNTTKVLEDHSESIRSLFLF